MSESFKLLDPVETLSSELTGKSDIERKNYLMTTFSLDSINTTGEKYGYWLLYQNGKSAIFSHKNNTLIKIPHAHNDSEYFWNITSMGIIPDSTNHTENMYVSVWWIVGESDVTGIEYLWIIRGNVLKMVDNIPRGSSLSTAQLLIRMQNQVQILGNSPDDSSVIDVASSVYTRVLH